MHAMATIICIWYGYCTVHSTVQSSDGPFLITVLVEVSKEVVSLMLKLMTNSR
jgi:hypothetical protein